IANRLVSVMVVAATAWLVLLRVRAFNDLERTNQSLSQLQQRVSEQTRLLNTASSVGAVGGWELEFPAKILRWSDEVARIHGLEPDDPVPGLANALAFYHQDDREMVSDCIDAAIQ